jgi:4-carboxymuconolactone decarboxylase
MTARLTPLTPDTLSPAQRAVHDRIASGTRGAVYGPFAVLLHSAELASRVEQLGLFIRYDCSVPHRLRELAILTVGAHWQADFEWFAHAGPAREAGLSDAVLEAVGARAEAPDFDDEADAEVYRFCRALLRDGRVPDALYAPVHARLGDTATVELTGLFGYYSLLAMQLNVFEVTPPAGTDIPWRRGA